MTVYSVAGGRLLADGRAVEMIPSRFTSGNFHSTPRVLVMHFTSGASARSSAEWFRSPDNKGSSAHLVIDRDGSTLQCVSFAEIAWHAGRSTWRGRSDLNRSSFGLELANWGDLERRGAEWVAGNGKPIANPVLAAHKNGNPDGSRHPIGWEPYPTAQFAAAAAIARALVAAYGITEIVGHDDIAPDRKKDPGPAFDMERFRREVFGAAPAPRSAEPIGSSDAFPPSVETPKDVQRALNALGYGPLAVDGDIGPASEAAVIRFQRVAGLIVDGDAGPKTRSALAAAMAGRV